jgi:hypothetical protein
MTKAKNTKLKSVGGSPACSILAVAEPSGDGRGVNLYVVFDGVRIARRGYPGTPQAGTWVSIEPGFEVIANGKHILIKHDGVTVQ